MSHPAPIAVFGFNRPTHLQQTLDALQANELASQSAVTVFLDAPRDGRDEDLCRQTREVAQTPRGFARLEVVCRERNLGCRRSIQAGISAMLEQAEAAIIVEDDIVTSPFFLRYMNDALRTYRDTPQVLSISAYNYPRGEFCPPRDWREPYYFATGFHAWGWGTWRDRWQRCRFDDSDLARDLQNVAFMNQVLATGTLIGEIMRAQHEGRCDTWDVFFWLEHVRRGGYSLFPAQSLTDNIGLEGNGTHCAYQYGLSRNDLSRCTPPAPLPASVTTDARILEAFRLCHSGHLSFWTRQKRSVRKRLYRWFGIKL